MSKQNSNSSMTSNNINLVLDTTKHCFNDAGIDNNYSQKSLHHNNQRSSVPNPYKKKTNNNLAANTNNYCPRNSINSNRSTTREQKDNYTKYNDDSCDYRTTTTNHVRKNANNNSKILKKTTTTPVSSTTSRTIRSRNTNTNNVGNVSATSCDNNNSNDLNVYEKHILPKLRPFQREAYEFATRGRIPSSSASSSTTTTDPQTNNNNNTYYDPNLLGKGRILLADEMGLGKTVTSLAIMAHYKREWPLLILCPASLRYTWPTEIEKFLPMIPPKCIHVISGWNDVTFLQNLQKQDSDDDDNNGIKIVIATFSLLQTRSAVAQTLLQECKNGSSLFKCIIVDESHNLRTKTSQRSKMAIPILQQAQRLVLLSGTPALAKPVELFVQLHVLAPKVFEANYTAYTRKYCAPKFRFGRMDVSGLSNAKELNAKLQQIMVRRLKSDVLHELPSKQRMMVPIDSATIDKSILQECRKQIEELNESRLTLSQLIHDTTTTNNYESTDDLRSKDFDARRLLTQAYQTTGTAKAQAVADYLIDWCMGSGTQKVLVFAHHKAVMDTIETALLKQANTNKSSSNNNTGSGYQYIRIDGTVPPGERNKLVKKFQTSPQVRVAVLSMTAAGVGLTLTAASTVMFAELHWTPAVLAQAEDRCHRIGQVNSVNIIYFVCNDASISVDMQLWKMLGRKIGTLDKVINGGNGKNNSMGARIVQGENEMTQIGLSSSLSSSAGPSVQEELVNFFAETSMNGGTGAANEKNRSSKKNIQPVVGKGSIMSFFKKQTSSATTAPAATTTTNTNLTNGNIQDSRGKVHNNEVNSDKSAKKDSTSKKDVQWTCHACTFLNSSSSLVKPQQRKCKICLSPFKATNEAEKMARNNVLSDSSSYSLVESNVDCVVIGDNGNDDDDDDNDDDDDVQFIATTSATPSSENSSRADFTSSTSLHDDIGSDEVVPIQSEDNECLVMTPSKGVGTCNKDESSDKNSNKKDKGSCNFSNASRKRWRDARRAEERSDGHTVKHDQSLCAQIDWICEECGFLNSQPSWAGDKNKSGKCFACEQCNSPYQVDDNAEAVNSNATKKKSKRHCNDKISSTANYNDNESSGDDDDDDSTKGEETKDHEDGDDGRGNDDNAIIVIDDNPAVKNVSKAAKLTSKLSVIVIDDDLSVGASSSDSTTLGELERPRDVTPIVIEDSTDRKAKENKVNNTNQAKSKMQEQQYKQPKGQQKQPKPKKQRDHCDAALTFSVSKNSGRIMIHYADNGLPSCCNFDINEVLTQESIDKLSDLQVKRRHDHVCKKNSKQSTALDFDKKAVHKLIGSLDLNKLFDSKKLKSNEGKTKTDKLSEQQRQQLSSEVREFVTTYLSLREIEKKAVKTCGEPIAAKSLRQSAAQLLLKMKAVTDNTVSDSIPATERYFGGARERAKHNLQQGKATSQDMDVLSGTNCAWCGVEPLSGASKLVNSIYCSQTCTEQGRLRQNMFGSSNIRTQLFALEGGICQLCGIDAHALFLRMQALDHPSERLNLLQNANWKIPKTKQSIDRLIHHPVEGDFWQADHIVAVTEGGGSCGLENLRTLCVPCHQGETEKLRARLKFLPQDFVESAEASSENKQRQMDIRSIFPAAKRKSADLVSTASKRQKN